MKNTTPVIAVALAASLLAAVDEATANLGPIACIASNPVTVEAVTDYPDTGQEGQAPHYFIVDGEAVRVPVVDGKSRMELDNTPRTVRYIVGPPPLGYRGPTYRTEEISTEPCLPEDEPGTPDTPRSNPPADDGTPTRGTTPPTNVPSTPARLVPRRVRITKKGPKRFRPNRPVQYTLRIFTNKSGGVNVTDTLPRGAFALVGKRPRGLKITTRRGRLVLRWRGKVLKGKPRVIRYKVRYRSTSKGRRCNWATAVARGVPVSRARSCGTAIALPRLPNLPSVTG